MVHLADQNRTHRLLDVSFLGGSSDWRIAWLVLINVEQNILNQDNPGTCCMYTLVLLIYVLRLLFLSNTCNPSSSLFAWEAGHQMVSEHTSHPHIHVITSSPRRKRSWVPSVWGRSTPHTSQPSALSPASLPSPSSRASACSLLENEKCGWKQIISV